MATTKGVKRKATPRKSDCVCSACEDRKDATPADDGHEGIRKWLLTLTEDVGRIEKQLTDIGRRLRQ